MELRINCRISSGVVILKLFGKLRVMECSLKGSVDNLVRMGNREFVLDLSELRYIDCFGLGQLISVMTSIETANGHMTLLNPRNTVFKVLEITKLDSVFRIEGIEGDNQRTLDSALKAPTIQASAVWLILALGFICCGFRLTL